MDGAPGFSASVLQMLQLGRAARRDHHDAVAKSGQCDGQTIHGLSQSCTKKEERGTRNEEPTMPLGLATACNVLPASRLGEGRHFTGDEDNPCLRRKVSAEEKSESEVWPR